MMTGWLNANGPAVQAIATVVLVVVTAAYGLFTYFLARATRLQGRPYVYFEVRRRGGMLDACLRNSGQRGAENVRVAAERDVKWGDDRGLLGWPLFRNPIPFLPPGGVISQPLTNLQTAGPKLYAMQPADRVLEYTVRYNDGKDDFSHSNKYDLSFLTPVGGDPFPLAGNDLALLREEVKKLNDTIDRGLGILHSDNSARQRG